MSVLNTKNLSPKPLSVITATIVSIVNTLLSLTLRPQWYMLVIVFVSTFIITYFIYYYTLAALYLPKDKAHL